MGLREQVARRIARGEVVVVEDKLAVQLTEIVKRTGPETAAVAVSASRITRTRPISPASIMEPPVGSSTEVCALRVSISGSLP